MRASGIRSPSNHLPNIAVPLLASIVGNVPASVGVARRAAHDLGHALPILHDLHAVAQLDVAIVALGDRDLLAIVTLHRHLDAAAAVGTAAVVAAGDGPGDGAAHQAQHCAHDAAAQRLAGDGADRGARPR